MSQDATWPRTRQAGDIRDRQLGPVATDGSSADHVLPADRRHYWAGRLKAKGSADSTRHVSELMDEIGVPSGVDSARRGLTMARGRWMYLVECGADHEVAVKGEAARHFDAAVDFLANYEAWAAGQAGAHF